VREEKKKKKKAWVIKNPSDGYSQEGKGKSETRGEGRGKTAKVGCVNGEKKKRVLAAEGKPESFPGKHG